MSNLGEFFDELIRRWKNGTDQKVFVSNELLDGFASLLRNEDFGIDENSFAAIKNPAHRERLQILLLSTYFSASAGATIGLQIGGPKGALIGALTGAAVGLVAGFLYIAVCVSPTPDGGGYVFSLLPV